MGLYTTVTAATSEGTVLHRCEKLVLSVMLKYLISLAVLPFLDNLVGEITFFVRGDFHPVCYSVYRRSIGVYHGGPFAAISITPRCRVSNSVPRSAGRALLMEIFIG